MCVCVNKYNFLFHFADPNVDMIMADGISNLCNDLQVLYSELADLMSQASLCSMIRISREELLGVVYRTQCFVVCLSNLHLKLSVVYILFKLYIVYFILSSSLIPDNFLMMMPE